MKKIILTTISLLFLSNLYAGDDASSKSDGYNLLEHLEPTLNMRLRYEYGENDTLDAGQAGTLRTRLGVKYKENKGFSGLAEYEDTLVFDEESYNAKGVHGDATKMVIADPGSREMNRLWLGYKAHDTSLKLGRQRITLDNSRFIGNVGWRQNEQTYDAASLVGNWVDDFTFTYAYLERVNGILGSRAPQGKDFYSSSHLVNLNYSGVENLTFAGYAYILDLENGVGFASSNQSMGLSVAGKANLSDSIDLKYRAEYANQTEAGDSTLDYSASYMHLNAGLNYKKYSFGFGWESLGSDKGVGFQFPLGTNHAFNGYADMFLGTPGNGLDDYYVTAGAKLPWKMKFKVAYHVFQSTENDVDYGSEVDVVLKKKICKNTNFIAKYAMFSADDPGMVDTTRFTAEINFKL